MSAKFTLVKKYYHMHMWNIDKVHAAVEKNWITAEEFEEITGQPYEV